MNSTSSCRKENPHKAILSTQNNIPYLQRNTMAPSQSHEIIQLRRRSISLANVEQIKPTLQILSRKPPNPSNLIENILEFTVANNFPIAYNLKMLQVPSTNLFKQLTSYLLGIYTDNLIEEVNNSEQIYYWLKTLGYPHTLSKSLLISITAPHSWGQALLIFNWLINMIKYKQQSQEEELEKLQKQPKSEIEIINQSLQSNDFSQHQAIQDMLNEKKAAILEQIDDVQQRVQTVQLSINNLNKEQQDVSEIEKDIRQLENLYSHEKELQTDISCQLQGVLKELQKLQQEQNIKLTTIQQLTIQNQKLQHELERQPFDAKEAKRMNTELEYLIKEVSKLKDTKESEEGKRDSLWKKLTIVETQLQNSIYQYNQTIKNILELANKYQQLVFNVDFSQLKFPLPEQMQQMFEKNQVKQAIQLISSISLKDCKASLKELIQTKNQQVEELKGIVQNQEKESALYQQKLFDAETEQQRLLQQLKLAETFNSTKQESYQLRQTSICSEEQQITEKINELKIELSQLVAAEQELATIVDENMNKYEDLNQTNNNVQDEISQKREDILKKVEKHQQVVLNQFKELSEQQRNLYQFLQEHQKSQLEEIQISK